MKFYIFIFVSIFFAFIILYGFYFYSKINFELILKLINSDSDNVFNNNLFKNIISLIKKSR